MANATDQQGVTLPINFTIHVSANDSDPKTDDFKAKIVIDFAPPVNNGFGAAPSSFNANTVHDILNFISERVIKKVVESVYYDVDNVIKDQKSGEYKPVKDLQLPENYQNAMGVYKARQEEKDKGNKNYLDHLELKNGDDENCIECIVDKFFNTKGRQVWNKEKNVTRITFEQMSPPSLTVETRTAVNGDKKPK